MGSPAPELPGWVWISGGVVLLAAAAWGWRQFAHAPPRRRVQTAGVGDEATDWFGEKGKPPPPFAKPDDEAPSPPAG